MTVHRRLARWVLAPAVAVSTALAPAAAASAEQVPVLVDQHGTHAIWVSPSEDYDVEDPTTYWDIVDLDGMCGFTKPTLQLSDMRETFFVQEKTQGTAAGSSTMLGKILDENFELTERAADGTAVRVYRGTGDEYAQAKHDADGSLALTNLNVVFRGASEDGRRLDFSLSLRLRTDQRTGEFTRFDGQVRSCHVR